MCDLPGLPWWDPEDTAESMLAANNEASEQLESSVPSMQMFKKRSMAMFVHIANKLEKTLPAGFDKLAIYEMLEEQLAKDSTSSTAELQGKPEFVWKAEGGSNTQQQLLQFIKATLYLCCPLRQPLTVENICTAHHLMMWGAVEEDGVPVDAGQLRATSAHSGTGFVYPGPDTIPAQLQQVVDNFNTGLAAGAASYCLAADLLYQFVALHPFSNGNGRMCRLLAAYAACASGVPFMLNLHNGHSKTCQHYQQTLRHADKHQGSTARLQSYIVECMHLQWQDALVYTGVSFKTKAQHS